MAGSSPLFFKASLSNMARASSRDSFALEEISARILNASTLRQNTSIPFLQEPFNITTPCLLSDFIAEGRRYISLPYSHNALPDRFRFVFRMLLFWLGRWPSFFRQEECKS